MKTWADHGTTIRLTGREINEAKESLVEVGMWPPPRVWEK
jgi:hypothetical protein